LALRLYSLTLLNAWYCRFLIAGEPDDQLNPKKKTWELIQPDLKTDENGVATYKGDPFLVVGRGVCTATGCANFPIK